MYERKETLGPLISGSTVVIIGGGPGGAGCAIALKNFADALGKEIRIVLYEGKVFASSTHYNQCAGVLSPPIVDILETGLQIPFPWDLIQKVINGYILHSEKGEIVLKGGSNPTYVTRRVTFDNYLLKQAKERGVEVIHSRVTDVEFNDEQVVIYSESNNSMADVVMGAFGMDDGTAKIFERVTPYRSPRFLSTIVTKIHPGEKYMSRFGKFIHVFLPPLKKIEFGAVTPKLNHLTINIAGMDINAESMDEFLSYPPVREILPTKSITGAKDLMYFKGRFPFQVSKGFYGNRYVLVGDSAGLLRPFKGKGINMSIVTAMKAVKTIMIEGISQKAFESDYRTECRNIIEDVPYGKIIRWLAIRSANLRLMNLIVQLAKRDPLLENALFNCVSAHKSFKEIFREIKIIHLILKVLGVLCFSFMRKLIKFRFAEKFQ